MFTQKLYEIKIMSIRRNKPWLISKLHEAGVMHINELKLQDYKGLQRPRDHDMLSKLSVELVKLKWIMDTLKPYYSEKKEPQFNSLSNTKVDELFMTSLELRRAIKPELEENVTELESLTKEFTEKTELYNLLKNINIDLPEEFFQENKYLFTTLFLHDEHEPLVRDLKKISKNIFLVNKENSYVLIALKEDKEKVLSTLNTHDSRIIQISKLNKIPLFVKQLKKDLFRLSIRIDNIKNKLKMLANSFLEETLKVNNDLEIIHSRYSVNNNFLVSENTFILSGFISKNDLKKLSGLKKDPYVTIQYSPAKETFDSDAPVIVPTKLTKSRYFRHFSFFTEMFGLPKYGLIDPTYFIGLFFPMFFGFMFSDIGYGLLLLLGSLYLGHKFREINQVKDIAFVFNMASIYTIIFGFLFGSFFGNLIKITPLWLDPFKKSLLILITALVIGIMHLNLGIALSLIEDIKKKDWKSLLLNQTGIILLQASVLLYVLGSFFGNLIPGHILLALSALLLIIKGGAFGLTEITGFVGIWLSYARILALSLATGGIALAMNIMAYKLGAIPAIGFILFAIMLVLGHAFNFLINILGSTIHSIRLHYVEFFSQFYDASGKPFKTFSIKKEKKVL